jgi:predicted O-methyltransferase YrrM
VTAGVAHVRAVIQDVVRGGILTDPDGEAHEVFPVAIPPAEGEALRDVVIAEGAAAPIEIGLGYGISALYICEGLLAADHLDARHVVIDPYQRTRYADLGLALLDRAGVSDLVSFRPGPSELALPALLEEAARFDFAFIDGNHRFDGVFVDLFYLGRLQQPGSAVFIDDYQLPGVRRATSFFVANVGWTVESVSEPDELHQWAVLRTPTRADERPYDHFVDF